MLRYQYIYIINEYLSEITVRTTAFDTLIVKRNLIDFYIQGFKKMKLSVTLSQIIPKTVSKNVPFKKYLKLLKVQVQPTKPSKLEI